jgi:hypothetical protein
MALAKTCGDAFYSFSFWYFFGTKKTEDKFLCIELFDCFLCTYVTQVCTIMENNLQVYSIFNLSTCGEILNSRIYPKL